MTTERKPYKLVLPLDHGAWDTYVRNHLNGTVYHLAATARIINKVYGHNVYFLGAVETLEGPDIPSLPSRLPEPNAAQPHPATPHEGFDATQDKIAGVLPLVHIRHAIFGNSLVSMPYFDMGGVLASSERAEEFLLQEAANIAARRGAREVELRHMLPLQGAKDGAVRKNGTIRIYTRSHKVRMVVKLPERAEQLMKSFKSKLRSQINKSIRDGLRVKVGGEELVDDFYGVFAVNMRDLGSPVHSRDFISSFLRELAPQARMVVVYKDGCPLSGSLVVKNGKTLANPWASSLQAYKRLNPNMLLYWAMLEYACDQRCRYFDFGRSTPDGGTYKFKAQWGARPEPLYWQYISVSGKREVQTDAYRNSSMDLARRVWMHLPVGLTRRVGPRVRKYISL